MTPLAVKQQLSKFRTAAERPSSEFSRWLVDAKSSVSFLNENAQSDSVLIYASMDYAWVHGVLAPSAPMSSPNVDRLLNANFDVEDSWCIQKSYGGEEGYKIYLEPPLSRNDLNELSGAEKLVYRRVLHGLKNYKAGTEISQKLIHCLNSFFMPERKSYSRLNDEGDIEDVITIHEVVTENFLGGEVAVFIDAQCLAEYMALSETVLIRKFDFTRFAKESFNGWGEIRRNSSKARDLAFNSGVSSNGSFVSGYHIARPVVTTADLVAQWREEQNPDSKKYENFKIYDFKNGRLIESNCGPGYLANYFTPESSLPFETSPVFFKAEVLQKYKSNPDKYELNDRSIACRNAWYLKTYDVNDEGQVHTYAVYLADLPYSEQLYWKAFNEWPKGPISKRAVENDFKGEYASERDPLQDLRQIIEDLDKEPPEWWSRRGGDLIAQVHYPVADSYREWSDEILILDQILIEGFNENALRAVLKGLNSDLKPPNGSLNVVQAILSLLGRSPEDAAHVLKPLREIHHLRSKTKGHSSNQGKALEQAALTEHGSHRAHFRSLADRSEISIKAIVNSLRAAS
jgi:hypothetical protein